MAIEHDDQDYQFAISLSVLNHLGRNLYRNFVTVLGEAISNAWDADATRVWIDIDRENDSFMISDDGVGMTSDDFENKFLKIGYSKRKEGGMVSDKGRPYIGAKGIGKLALLSCADKVSIFTHTENTPYTGGVIINEQLDAAIQNDLVPDQYPLEQLNYDLIEDVFERDSHGTTIVFEGAGRVLSNTDGYIRKILALSFQFSLIDPNFTIYVNDEEINVSDLASLSEKTQFLWTINGYDDEYLATLDKLARPKEELTANLPISGYIASVQLPRHAKIRGMDERVTIDLFVNGRVRDKNVIRHVPTQRIVESYIYGQIHFDALDRENADPFTSSREGIVENDEEFQKLLEYIQKVLLPKVFDDWDKFRGEIGKEGDDENPRRTKKERKAAALVSAAEEEFTGDLPPEQKNTVDGWVNEIRPDAQFNVSAYIDCFLSENLVRKFMLEKQIAIHNSVTGEVKKYRTRETQAKQKANINFDIRRDDNDLLYLGMNELAICAEGGASQGGQVNPMVQSATAYKPARDAVGHTSLLAEPAKLHLTVTFENIKGRVKALLSDMEP
ncbi:MAG: DNA mismatch repair protein [Sphingomonadaceae bacterium]|nr:DNA mismatch repair protein [Sphingomonadaceae bacterium]